MNIKELKEKIAHLPDDMEVYGESGQTEQGGGIYDHSPSAAVYKFEDEFSGYEGTVLLICTNHNNDEDSCCGTMERVSYEELAEINYAAAKKDLHSRVVEDLGDSIHRSIKDDLSN